MDSSVNALLGAMAVGVGSPPSTPWPVPPARPAVAASERRIVLVDGYVSGAAALVARGLSADVADYLVYAHRTAETGHRLMLIHL